MRRLTTVAGVAWATPLTFLLAAGCAGDPHNPADPASQEYATLNLVQCATTGRCATGSTTASGSGTGESGPCNPCKIFITAANNQPSVDFTGITGADARCMSDANHPGTGTYRALLVSPGVRVACTSANCSGGPAEHTDWVLRANTTYKRQSDGLTIMTTNANGIHDFGAPLTNPIGTGVAGWWTGLNSNWTSNSACTGNTWSSTAGNGNFGDPNMTTGGSISNGLDGCTTTGSKLLCVEQ